MGTERPNPGTIIQTDFGLEAPAQPTRHTRMQLPHPMEPLIPSTPTDTPTEVEPVIYHTVMTGTALDISCCNPTNRAVYDRFYIKIRCKTIIL